MPIRKNWLDPQWKQRDHPHCLYCAKPMTQRRGRGRPRKTCSDRCRQAESRAQNQYARAALDARVGGRAAEFAHSRWWGDWRRGLVERELFGTDTRIETAAP